MLLELKYKSAKLQDEKPTLKNQLYFYAVTMDNAKVNFIVCSNTIYISIAASSYTVLANDLIDLNALLT